MPSPSIREARQDKVLACKEGKVSDHSQFLTFGCNVSFPVEVAEETGYTLEPAGSHLAATRSEPVCLGWNRLRGESKAQKWQGWEVEKPLLQLPLMNHLLCFRRH